MTEKQWRAAIAGGDLKPDHLVEYEAPDCSPDTRSAGDVPELQALFAELLPGFGDWRRPADPVPQVLPEPEGSVSPDEASAPEERTALVEAAAAARPVEQRSARQARQARARVASVKPTRPVPASRGKQDQNKPASPFLIGGGAIVVLLLVYAVFSGPEDEAEPVEQIASSAAESETVTPVPTETNTAPDPAPSPTPDARAAALRERERLQREARSTPTPTPTPTIAPPPPPPVASQARAVQPRDLARWANRIGSDYPRRAAQRGEQGTVGFRVTVGPNGRVEACDITSSSGSVDLDRAACQGVTRYARFNPALNDAGEPIAASWSSAITYRLD